MTFIVLLVIARAGTAAAANKHEIPAANPRRLGERVMKSSFLGYVPRHAEMTNNTCGWLLWQQA
ncbi:MAG: hypothetical protein ACRYHQ_25415 [Janthinobacterium lividum]